MNELGLPIRRFTNDNYFLAKYRVIWEEDGEVEVLVGFSLPEALEMAGYGRGAVGMLRSWKLLKLIPRKEWKDYPQPWEIDKNSLEWAGRQEER